MVVITRQQSITDQSALQGLCLFCCSYTEIPGIRVWFLFLLLKNLPFCLGKNVNTGKNEYVARETSRYKMKKKYSQGESIGLFTSELSSFMLEGLLLS